ncbi:ferredoxin [Clostridium botulinum]|uniref:2-oxoacid:acceptor oxidoreductase, delta subunit, pyruvate/2-ketoisovalerate family n=1 Tax=Clostridium botulinum D str. 1873 TaxID=592027 RepID=A0A9P2G6Z3_CLOBO|nr:MULTISPECIES: 4Fe-4S binding protein [Clostridium]EES91186.1 2-oxoacid:acceptor oxidoreductase, delta subunit, pyruvate/2-ketoisovalerate family [Clostridium botulinum D str. 1873]MBO3441236.1 4Fe-4S binding protein [Clostridium haemolyticum]NFV47412.1 ferredoxin [Clostridium botulinum]QPW54986.1 4Fe-4S binding protein [Clostridium botulinum]
MSKKMDVTSESKCNEIPIGGQIIEAGNSVEFNTGDWRSMRPVWHEDKCKHCMFCWAVCPDMSIIVKNEKVIGIDYDHCKGCGVCTKQCKFGALEFVAE